MTTFFLQNLFIAALLLLTFSLSLSNAQALIDYSRIENLLQQANICNGTVQHYQEGCITLWITVGAKKSGTTTFIGTLYEHTKSITTRGHSYEHHFWEKSLEEVLRDFENYLSWPARRIRRKVFAFHEKTPSYLVGLETFRNLHKVLPPNYQRAVRLLVLLRDPIKRIHSDMIHSLAYSCPLCRSALKRGDLEGIHHVYTKKLQCEYDIMMQQPLTLPDRADDSDLKRSQYWLNSLTACGEKKCMEGEGELGTKKCTLHRSWYIDCLIHISQEGFSRDQIKVVLLEDLFQQQGKLVGDVIEWVAKEHLEHGSPYTDAILKDIEIIQSTVLTVSNMRKYHIPHSNHTFWTQTLPNFFAPSVQRLERYLNRTDLFIKWQTLQGEGLEKNALDHYIEKINIPLTETNNRDFWKRDHKNHKTIDENIGKRIEAIIRQRRERRACLEKGVKTYCSLTLDENTKSKGVMK